MAMPIEISDLPLRFEISDLPLRLQPQARAQMEGQSRRVVGQENGEAVLEAVVTNPRPKSRRSPLNMKPTPAKISEHKRQNQVIVTLRSLGYTVLEIGQKRQPIFCKCGAKHWPITTGNTTGTPDLLVSHARWGTHDGPGIALFLGIEMKAPNTKRRPEQLTLNALGMSVIVETVREALGAIAYVEQKMGLAELPALAAYREQLTVNKNDF